MLEMSMEFIHIASDILTRCQRAVAEHYRSLMCPRSTRPINVIKQLVQFVENYTRPVGLST
jgi:hypothetical protein